MEPPWIFEITRLDQEDVMGDTLEELNLKAVLPPRWVKDDEQALMAMSW